MVLPIFFEPSFRVTHRMSIFTLDHRPLRITFRVCFRSFVIVVHRTEDIRIFILLGLFVLHRTTFIFFFHPTVTIFEIRPEAGFVPHRPCNDGRMVISALKIALITFEVCDVIRSVFGQRQFSVSHTVRLYIRFGHNVKSVLVAEVVP